MGLTPNYEIPYPELPDPADVPFYSKAQAEKVDEILADTVLRAVPTGSIVTTIAPSAPDGYMFCDGSPALESSAPDLHALLISMGSPFGTAGAGPRVPDLRGRVAVGRNVGSEFDAVGDTGGASKHTLIADEMPTHSHQNNGMGGFIIGQAGQVAAGADRPGPVAGAPTQANTKTAGLGAEHENMPPYLTLNWIIKI